MVGEEGEGRRQRYYDRRVELAMDAVRHGISAECRYISLGMIIDRSFIVNLSFVKRCDY